MKKTNILLGSAIVLTSLLNAGSVFAATSTGSDANPVTANTPVSTTLTVPNTNTPKAPTDPNDPDKGLNEQGTVNGEDGNLGIAYYPKAFNFSGKLGADKLVLNDTGTNVAQGVTYNIGVKDNTHTNNSWTLTAKLSWTTGSLPGSTIKLTNSGVVKQNINNGIDNFQEANLVEQNPQVVTGNSNVIIGDSATNIMTKPSSTIGIGTYDYQLAELGDLQLDIPNATSLQAGDYAGTVTWDLAVVPGTAVN